MKLRHLLVSSNVSGTMNRLGGPASVAAGVLWLLIWLHQRATHGSTATNEMQPFSLSASSCSTLIGCERKSCRSGQHPC